MKFKSLLGLSLVLALCGCMKLSDLTDTKVETNKKETETVEEEEKSSVLKCTNDNEEDTFVAKGDKILNMTQIIDLSFDDLGITDDMNSVQIQADINDTLDEKYGDIEGVSLTSSVLEDKVEVTVQIDFQVADLDELVKNGLLAEGEVKTDYVSLKKSKSDLKSNGYACTAQ